MTHRTAGVRARLTWSLVGAFTTLALAGVPALPAAAATESPSAATVDGRTTLVVARGPFGSVAGLPLTGDAPLPDPTALEVLDAYGRGASLTMSPAAGSLDQWRVTSSREPSLDPAAEVELGAGGSSTGAIIRLPSSGLFLLRLDGTVVDPTSPDDPGRVGSWVWRIAVPDRDVPRDGDPYPPMPAVVLSSGDRSVDLDPGSGCFVGTCGDIGATSPPQTLPTIRTIAGAPLTVRLSDGSGIDSWSADATPIGTADEETITVGRGHGDRAMHTLTFAAPAEGRWVILVHVRFDHDRGTSDGYGRLILGSDAPAGTVGPVDGPG